MLQSSNYNRRSKSLNSLQHHGGCWIYDDGSASREMFSISILLVHGLVAVILKEVYLNLSYSMFIPSYIQMCFCGNLAVLTQTVRLPHVVFEVLSDHY